jgi:hypothetical protein
MRKVQQEIHFDHAGIRVRQEKFQMPKVQEHESEAADHVLSGHNVEEELSSYGMSSLP